MKLAAEVKWAAVDEAGWKVSDAHKDTLRRAKQRWTDIQQRHDEASKEVCASIQACTAAYLTLENICDDATMEAWFDGGRCDDLGIDDQLDGTDITISALSFAEAEQQARMDADYALVPSIRASCFFELPITKTKEELLTINANRDLEPLHWLVNFEVGGVWLGHADSISLCAHVDSEEIALRG